MTLEEKVREAIDGMQTPDVVDMWNEYCISCNMRDDIIYDMSDFNEVMEYESPWRIARACCYGDFCAAHDYFWFNSYGNLESTDFPSMDDKSPFYAKALATWIIKNENALYCDEIQEILDEDDEEEKDEDEEDE